MENTYFNAIENRNGFPCNDLIFALPLIKDSRHNITVCACDLDTADKLVLLYTNKTHMPVVDWRRLRDKADSVYGIGWFATHVKHYDVTVEGIDLDTKVKEGEQNRGRAWERWLYAHRIEVFGALYGNEIRLDTLMHAGDPHRLDFYVTRATGERCAIEVKWLHGTLGFFD